MKDQIKPNVFQPDNGPGREAFLPDASQGFIARAGTALTDASGPADPIVVEDALRTYVEHVAIQISNNLKGNDLKVLITGGGVKNKFLIKRIKKISNQNFETISKNIIDYKEALIFGFLGVLKIRNENNCLKSVTGANEDHSSGVIFQ